MNHGWKLYEKVKALTGASSEIASMTMLANMAMLSLRDVLRRKVLRTQKIRELMSPDCLVITIRNGVRDA